MLDDEDADDLNDVLVDDDGRKRLLPPEPLIPPVTVNDGRGVDLGNEARSEDEEFLGCCFGSCLARLDDTFEEREGTVVCVMTVLCEK